MVDIYRAAKLSLCSDWFFVGHGQDFGIATISIDTIQPV